VVHLRTSFTTVALLLLPACFGNAEDKSPTHLVIPATPEQIKKGAMTMFARNGYSLDRHHLIFAPAEPGCNERF